MSIWWTVRIHDKGTNMQNIHWLELLARVPMRAAGVNETIRECVQQWLETIVASCVGGFFMPPTEWLERAASLANGDCHHFQNCQETQELFLFGFAFRITTFCTKELVMVPFITFKLLATAVVALSMLETTF